MEHQPNIYNKEKGSVEASLRWPTPVTCYLCEGSSDIIQRLSSALEGGTVSSNFYDPDKWPSPLKYLGQSYLNKARERPWDLQKEDLRPNHSLANSTLAMSTLRLIDFHLGWRTIRPSVIELWHIKVSLQDSWFIQPPALAKVYFAPSIEAPTYHIALWDLRSWPSASA